jgi:hypothetical protein
MSVLLTPRGSAVSIYDGLICESLTGFRMCAGYGQDQCLPEEPVRCVGCRDLPFPVLSVSSRWVWPSSEMGSVSFRWLCSLHQISSPLSKDLNVCISPVFCHIRFRTVWVCTFHVFSLSSFSRPISARMPDSSFSGSPRWSLTLTNGPRWFVLLTTCETQCGPSF